MSVLKDEAEMRLDGVAAAVSELCEQIDVLCDLGAAEKSFLDALAEWRESFAGTLERLQEARRAANQLPAEGNKEKADFRAAGLAARTLFSRQSDRAVISRKLIEDVREIPRRCAKAGAVLEGQPAIRKHLETIAELARSAAAELGPYAGEAD